MSTTKSKMTADELLAMPKDGHRYELVKGELQQMVPAGGEHGVTTMKLGARLEVYVDDHDLGVVCAAKTGFTIATDPDTVRASDIGFVSKARIPASGIPKGYWPFAPDLAVEVISPNDIYTEVEEKIGDWLIAGSKLVAVINPRKREVKVYRSLTDITIFKESEQLHFGDLIAGFTFPVAKLFQ